MKIEHLGKKFLKRLENRVLTMLANTLIHVTKSTIINTFDNQKRFGKK
jgi:hypothetical protein